MTQPKNFQDFIFSLSQYWINYGCLWSQPYDSPMGAGTFHPHTFLKGLGPEPWRSVYVQPCRRPVDGRYGKSPYRFQHYYQLQVLLKPSPSNIIDIFLQSLEHVGINLKNNDIGLLEDDWKGPTLGAWGLGWEVRANAQEVTQFTYFQQLGGLDIDVVCGEITYGLERLYMYANGIKNGLDIPYNDNFTWGDIYFQNEYEFSFFNFKEANVSDLFTYFDQCENKVSQLCEKNLILPAYDYVLQASHSFNLLDARGAISVSERQRYIGRVRDCAKKCAAVYKNAREKLGFPLLNKLDNDARNPLFPKNSPLNINPSQTNTSTNSILNYQENLDFKEKDTVSVLFELGVEEMPPSFQKMALKELYEKVNNFISNLIEKFKSDTLYCGKLNALKFEINVSSRRISMQFFQAPVQEPNQKIEIWGPAERIAKNSDGTLSQAGLGFCKKNQVDEKNISFKTKAEGVFITCEKVIVGSFFPSVLAQEFKNWCYTLNAPLKMKWLPAEISPSFIRPVRSILALVENKIIPLQMYGIFSSNFTYGQRILSPQKIEINHATNYAKIMAEYEIEISFEKRKKLVLSQANDFAEKVKGKLILDENLLDKCAGLFECPYVFYAEFDQTYLSLPGTLITSVLKEHMNYFTIQEQETNKLLPFYIGVANYKCNHIDKMIDGTKNVVTGRLDDGAFYYESDLSTPLAEFRERLKTQTFQENMGTLFDKTERLSNFSNLMQEKYFPNLDLEILQTSSQYCKADLKAGCVLEFPDDMQGIMGGVLARKQNILSNKERSEVVATAIEQHYLPTNAQSSLPSNQYALLLSLMDKLDSLCLLIHFGFEPKGNKDPLGMRRLGLSIARILGLKQEKHSLNLSLVNCLKLCFQNLSHFNIPILESTEQKIRIFLLDRIKSSLKETFDPRAVEALTAKLLYSPIKTVIPFIQILDSRIKDENYSLISSLNPYRRACNLTQNMSIQSIIQTEIFQHQSEKNLFNNIQVKKERLNELLQSQLYSQVLDELESFTEPLAQFFEGVMVNDPSPQIKENRLALLLQVRKLYEDIADFSLLQV